MASSATPDALGAARPTSAALIPVKPRGAGWLLFTALAMAVALALAACSVEPVVAPDGTAMLLGTPPPVAATGMGLPPTPTATLLLPQPPIARTLVPSAPGPASTPTPTPTPALMATPARTGMPPAMTLTFVPGAMGQAPTETPTPIPTGTPTPTPLPGAALVHIGATSYTVDLALTPEERAQGLSGRPSMAVGSGMLFVYESDQPLGFWMPEMHFPLDMVWIRADCVVAGVTADVPNPSLDTPRDQLPVYPSTGNARFVLELNAGQAAANGIAAGGAVRFDGRIAGRWGC